MRTSRVKPEPVISSLMLVRWKLMAYRTVWAHHHRKSVLVAASTWVMIPTRHFRQRLDVMA